MGWVMGAMVSELVGGMVGECDWEWDGWWVR